MAFSLLSAISFAHVDVTFVPETNLTAETKPALDGNFISLSYANDYSLKFFITKQNSEGDLIWSNGITKPEETTFLQHIFAVNNGHYEVLFDIYFIKLNASSEFISSVYYTAETLVYCRIPGEIGYVNYIDVTPVDDRFIYLTTDFAELLKSIL